jgi:hypothetical protein
MNNIIATKVIPTKTMKRTSIIELLINKLSSIILISAAKAPIKKKA